MTQCGIPTSTRNSGKRYVTFNSIRGSEMPKICRFEGDGRNKPCKSEVDRTGSFGLCGRCYRRMRKDDRIEKYKQMARDNGELQNDKRIVGPFLIEQVRKSLNEGVTPSVRHLYYRCVAGNVIKKDSGGSETNYQFVVNLCVDLRKEGRIGWDEIVDESRSSFQQSHYDNTETSPYDLARRNLVNAYQYQVNPWGDKDHIAELWVEDRSTGQVVRGLCNRLCVDLVPLGGQTSWAYVYGEMVKIRDRDKPTVILGLTDYDPAGMIIHQAVDDKIAFFLNLFGIGGKVEIHRIGITPEQIEEYDLITQDGKCQIQAMEHKDLESLVRKELSPYITIEEIDQAKKKGYKLDEEVDRINERLLDVLEEEFLYG